MSHRSSTSTIAPKRTPTAPCRKGVQVVDGRKTCAPWGRTARPMITAITIDIADDACALARAAAVMAADAYTDLAIAEIGRASCGERMCQYVWISVVGGIQK